MATVPDRELLDIEEQIARIRKTMEHIDRSTAETRKSVAEKRKLYAVRNKLRADTELTPRSMIFQAMLATAALIGAGAAIARFSFH